jgi:hypothetical protein
MKQFFRTLFAFLTGQKYVMMGEPAKGETKSVTLGPTDAKGYSSLFINGEESKVRLLTFTNEEIDRFQKIGKELRDK